MLIFYFSSRLHYSIFDRTECSFLYTLGFPLTLFESLMHNFISISLITSNFWITFFYALNTNIRAVMKDSWSKTNKFKSNSFVYFRMSGWNLRIIFLIDGLFNIHESAYILIYYNITCGSVCLLDSGFKFLIRFFG